MRHFRLLLAAGLACTVIGAAAAYACGKDTACNQKASVQKASVEQASAGTCTAGSCAGHAAMKASAGTCAGHASCSGKDMAQCPYCEFSKELGASAAKISFTTHDTDDGVVLVFTALDKNDVVTAQAVASKAYALMNGPAECSYSRANMEKEACAGCKHGVEAFAGATVTIENTADGARAQVTAKGKADVEALHDFVKTMKTHEEEAAKG